MSDPEPSRRGAADAAPPALPPAGATSGAPAPSASSDATDAGTDPGKLGPPGPPAEGERRRRNVGWRSRDVLRTAALVVGLYVGLKLLWAASPLVLTIFLGVLFGLAVEAGVDRLARFRIPRGIAAASIVFGFIGLLVGIGAWMAPTLREQSGELRTRLPQAVDNVERWMDQHQSGFLGVLVGGRRPSAAVDSATHRAGGAPARGDSARGDSARAGAQRTEGRAEQRAGAAADTAGSGHPAPSLRQRIGSAMGGATRYLFPFLTSTIAVFGGILLIMFLAIYIAADPDLYHRGLMHLFPKRSRDRTGEVLSAMATALRKWLVTQLIAMLVIGSVTTIALLVLKVKAAFALGIIAGLLEFVPTIGPLMSAVPAVTMGFLDSPEKALYIAFAYMAIQFLENHILIPLLMKGGVDLPPALTIIAQALMAMIFGFLGLMVAVPALAAMLVAIRMLYVEGVIGDDMEALDEEGPG